MSRFLIILIDQGIGECRTLVAGTILRIIYRPSGLGRLIGMSRLGFGVRIKLNDALDYFRRYFIEKRLALPMGGNIDLLLSGPVLVRLAGGVPGGHPAELFAVDVKDIVYLITVNMHTKSSGHAIGLYGANFKEKWFFLESKFNILFIIRKKSYYLRLGIDKG